MREVAFFASEVANASNDDVSVVARLNCEIDKLHQTIVDLTEQSKSQEEALNDAIKQAIQKAKSDAREEYVADEARRLELLEVALVDCRNILQVQLQQSLLPLAKALASDALSVLIGANKTNSEWLANAIAERIATLEQGLIVAVRASAADVQTLSERLRDGMIRIAPNQIVQDAACQQGEVHIDLVLGSIPVSIKEGGERLLNAIETSFGTPQPHV